jgi:HTH-type transcriptional regulator/antitoxin HigA
MPEKLRAGQLIVKALKDLPRAFAEARLRAGLTQAKLAERIGIKAQQIQRYEATRYQNASLKRLIEVACALEEASETSEAMSELEAGKGEKFESVDALMKDLNESR